MPKCCTAHIAHYIGVNDKEYPREGAALCCAECKARLTFNSGKWARLAQEDMHLAPEPKPKKGGLLDVADS